MRLGCSDSKIIMPEEMIWIGGYAYQETLNWISIFSISFWYVGAKYSHSLDESWSPVWKGSQDPSHVIYTLPLYEHSSSTFWILFLPLPFPLALLNFHCTLYTMFSVSTDPNVLGKVRLRSWILIQRYNWDSLCQEVLKVPLDKITKHCSRFKDDWFLRSLILKWCLLDSRSITSNNLKAWWSQIGELLS